VAGNQTVEKVTLNALNLLAAAGLGHVGMDSIPLQNFDFRCRLGGVAHNIFQCLLETIRTC
jgi:hypothetical protein